MNLNSIIFRKVEDWAEGFKILYTEADKYRAPEEFWNATMAHISGIGEAIRRIDYRELLISAAHAFCWMNCYVKRCNNTEDELFYLQNNISEIVGLKYPKKCGHCEDDCCHCDPVKMDKAKDKSAKFQNLYSEGKDIKFEAYTLEDWLRVFWNIYSGQIHLLALESIGFHLLEEAGEEAKAVRQLVQFRGITTSNIDGIDKDYLILISKIPGLVEEYMKSMERLKQIYNVKSEKEALSKIDFTDKNPDILRARLVKGKMDFVIEIADTFSWFCAVLLKLSRIIENEILEPDIVRTFHIEEVIKKVYQSSDKTKPLICYACKKTSCKCLFFPKLDN